MPISGPSGTDLESAIERALAPYRDLLTPRQLALFRERLAEAVAEDPLGQKLVAAIRPRAIKHESGDEPVVKGAEDRDRGAQAAEAPAKRNKRG